MAHHADHVRHDRDHSATAAAGGQDGHAHADAHSHEHEHGHHHGIGGHQHGPVAFGRAFAAGVALNAAYVLTEAFSGIAVHSMALLADAGHNLGDVAGLLGAWLAAWLGTHGPTAAYTYGLRRSSILAALANAVLLLVVTGGIAWGAIERLVTPEPTAGFVIMVVSLGGVAVNGLTAWLFMAGRKSDLNIKAAFMHMAADAMLTLGVAVAGGIIMLTGWLRVDPAVSLVLSAVIVVGTWSLLRDSVNLSLDAVPGGIRAQEVETYLRSLPGVEEVHDLHVWGMSTTETALTAHLVRQDADRDGALLEKISREVRAAFGIGHATIQFETRAVAARCALRPDHVI
jgi:cobalt-zinc-cadmium efflux system protein